MSAPSSNYYAKDMKPPTSKLLSKNSRMIVIGILVILVALHTWFNSNSQEEEILIKAKESATTDVLTTNRHASTEKVHNYMAVIDAGSSGSRIHVYKYTYNDDSTTTTTTHYATKVVEPDHETMKSKPGLSSFVSHPQDAGNSLEPLIAFAKEHVPINKIETTPILLKATAGMRIAQEQHAPAVDSILQSVKSTLQTSGFRFTDSNVNIISGQEEGMLGWLALNYLHERHAATVAADAAASSNLRGGGGGGGASGNFKMWSVLEMGGASAQVSVPLSTGTITTGIPDSSVLPYSSPTSGQQGSMYTHSFLGFGVQSAKEAVEEALFAEEEEGQQIDVLHHPCLPDGYTEEMPPLHDHATTLAGTGNLEECQRIIQKAVFASKRKEDCESETCFWNGDASPPNLLEQQLWAFENFFYTMSGVGEMESDESNREFQIKDYERVAKEMCPKAWDDIEDSYPKDAQPKEYNSDWCFSAVYAYSFLTIGLGLDGDQALVVGNAVENVGIDWALGAVLEHHPQDR